MGFDTFQAKLVCLDQQKYPRPWDFPWALYTIQLQYQSWDTLQGKGQSREEKLQPRK